MTGSDSSTAEHFRVHGWVRIPGAFSASAASAMCDVIWAGLARQGIQRDDPSTWTAPRPIHLQQLKADPASGAIGTDRTIQAIDAMLEGQSWWRKPRDWGAFFLQFPVGNSWDIPHSGWHIDGDYAGQVSPACGVLVHAMLNDVEPRSGGVNILSGSHRLLHRWFQENPLPPKSRAVQFRKSLERHLHIRDLCTAGDPAARIARFHHRVEEVDGIPLQVLENTAAAGDLIIMHTLLLHAGAPAAHLGRQPRFLVSQSICKPYW